MTPEQESTLARALAEDLVGCTTEFLGHHEAEIAPQDLECVITAGLLVATTQLIVIMRRVSEAGPVAARRIHFENWTGAEEQAILAVSNSLSKQFLAVLKKEGLIK